MPLTLITPTGGRPEAFSLLEGFVSRQTYRGEVQWIVSDDCDPPTPYTMGQIVVRPTPPWSSGRNTQCRNLLSILPLVRYDKILCLEDDDWYSPHYLDVMSKHLDSFSLIGETHAHYYNISHRTYHVVHNTRHASLCQTCFRSDVLPFFKGICQRSPMWVDLDLWRLWRGNHELIHPSPGSSPLCVGIKGMPGRKGIGAGHRIGGKPDLDGKVLREWVGEDADLYTPYHSQDSRQVMSDHSLGPKDTTSFLSTVRAEA